MGTRGLVRRRFESVCCDAHYQEKVNISEQTYNEVLLLFGFVKNEMIPLKEKIELQLKNKIL